MGTLVIALLCSYAARPFFKSDRVETRAHRARTHRARRDVQHDGRRWFPTSRGAVTIGLVAALVGIIFAWGTLATRTTGQVLTDGRVAITAGSIQVMGGLPGSSTQPEMVVRNLRQEGLQARAAAAPGTYLPWSAVSKAETPVVEQQLTPLTAIGRDLNSIGIPVATLNSLARSLVAYGEELFLAIGLLSLFIQGWRQGRLVGGQFFWLSVGCTCMIVLITVLPSISADYGALRAFQQGLLFFGPIIVIGSMTIFAPIGRYRAWIARCVICLGVFLATSTLVPQILGNNLAELNLNNSGVYYNLYYTTAQEAVALEWLEEQPDVLRYPIQASWDYRRFFLTSPGVISGKEGLIDQYPTLVYQNSWVILGHSTTSSGISFSNDPLLGDIIEYEYPTELLHDYKNLVYTSGGAIIYK